jgi:hypothetical protein
MRLTGFSGSVGRYVLFVGTVRICKGRELSLPASVSHFQLRSLQPYIKTPPVNLSPFWIPDTRISF